MSVIKHRKHIWLSLALLFSIGIGSSLIYPVSLEKVSGGWESIQSRRIQATLSFLASEHLKGRGTGTAEAGLTAAYIASSFQRNGLCPLEKGKASFIQSFELSQALPQSNSALSLEEEQGKVTSFKMGENFIPGPWGPDCPGIEGEAVFAGYGITAKEFHYDDYATPSVAGKVVVILSKYPEATERNPFRNFTRKDYEDPMGKALQAERLGAIGVIVILPSGEELPSLRELNFKKTRTYLVNEIQPIRIPSVFVPYGTGEMIVQRQTKVGSEGLAEIKKRIDDQLTPQSFALGKKIRIQTTYQWKRFLGNNVMGMIPGSDPSLKEEIIILGAHHDHLGVGENDEIYYGADDDASGTTGLLELAEAFQRNPLKPRRSLVFAAWGAEEVGLLGSRYYAEHPLVPLRDTIAMIQMDMIGRNEERGADPSKDIQEERPEKNINSLNAMGTPFSPGLKELLTVCNQRVGLDLRFRFDFGSENLNKRSDHWPFLNHGIPSLLLFSGFHPDYHKTSDTAEKINFAKMEKVLKLVYLASWELADRAELPRFDGSPFSPKS